MSDKFNDFIDAVADGAKDLAKDVFGGFEEQAKDDAKAFLVEGSADFKRWTKMLAAKKLSEDEFGDLVSAKKAVAKMHALTQEGIALTKLERFRTGLIDLVINTARDVFG